MSAKVENFCARKFCKRICVDNNERACINCIWYEQYHRQSRGNIYDWVPVSTGYCLLEERTRGALSKPCARFETERREEC